jgi:hypothetical protein
MEKQSNFYSIIGFLIIGIFILTSGKGINLKKVTETKYLQELWDNGKKIIIKESTKITKNLKGTYLFSNE